MGIVRKLRQLNAVGRAANEAAAAAGAPPQMQRGMVAGFANVMAQAMAPQMAANRAAPDLAGAVAVPAPSGQPDARVRIGSRLPGVRRTGRSGGFRPLPVLRGRHNHSHRWLAGHAGRNDHARCVKDRRRCTWPSCHDRNAAAAATCRLRAARPQVLLTVARGYSEANT